MADQKMTESERQEFLAGLHVGVLGIERPDGPPLVVPVWYSYEPGGDVEVLTSASSLKGRLAASAGRASLCVQQEDLPYKYVSVEGALEIVELDAAASQRPSSRWRSATSARKLAAGMRPRASDPTTS